MDTFSLMNESVFHAENEEPVPDGIQGTIGCAGARGGMERTLGRGAFQPLLGVDLGHWHAFVVGRPAFR